jgi:hypothetical protein
MDTQIISFEEYQSLHIPVLFSDKFTDRKFGILTNELFRFKFGWQSDELSPLIYKFNNYRVIGIDLNCSIINVEDIENVYTFSLQSFFCEAKLYVDNVFIVSEIEILVFNMRTNKLLKKISLSDIYCNLDIGDNNITVTYLNDNEEIFEI